VRSWFATSTATDLPPITDEFQIPSGGRLELLLDIGKELKTNFPPETRRQASIKKIEECYISKGIADAIRWTVILGETVGWKRVVGDVIHWSLVDKGNSATTNGTTTEKLQIVNDSF
jgi:hypothetical protein